MSHSYEDIVPVKLNEEAPQLCQILYDDNYKTTMGILLALMQKKEYSERSLEMTELGIEILASHYSIWCYRFDIIKHLHKDLYEELEWLETIAIENEKNYQIWNYRQLIIKEIDNYDAMREFPILNTMILEDSKNHHVWTYRHWLIEKFNLFNNERENLFIDELIENDVYNNSAWTHRFFLKFGKIDDTTISDSTTKTDSELESDLITKEIEFVKLKIRLSPQNESTWNYLLGIFEKFNIDLTELKDFIKEFVNLGDELIKSSFALEILAKIDKSNAIEIYDLLILKYDPIRENYWNYLKSQVV